MGPIFALLRSKFLTFGVIAVLLDVVAVAGPVYLFAGSPELTVIISILTKLFWGGFFVGFALRMVANHETAKQATADVKHMVSQVLNR